MAALAGLLVALAVLLWGAGHPSRRIPSLGGGSARVLDGPTSPGRRWAAGRLTSRRGRRDAERTEAEALALLDGIVPALRAGLPPVTAMRLVTASRTLVPAGTAPRRRPRAFRAAGAEGADGGAGPAALEGAASRGEPLAPAWAAYAAAADSDDLRLVAAAWSLCETLGSPLAPTVATVAEVVRRRRAVRHRIAAVLAGPQATMRVLTVLPLSGPVVAMAVGVAPTELYTGPAGLSAMAAGLTLLLVGRAWASRMIRGVMSEQRPGAWLRALRGRRRDEEPHVRS